MTNIHYWKQGICHQPALCHLPADGKERLCHLLIKNRWQRTDRRQRTWLPSANSLPSASGWQIIFAICQQMAKRLANPVAVKSVTAYQPHLFAICQQTAKILCHLLADGKEMGLSLSLLKKAKSEKLKKRKPPASLKKTQPPRISLSPLPCVLDRVPRPPHRSPPPPSPVAAAVGFPYMAGG